MEWAVILLTRILDYLFICDGGRSIAIKVGNVLLQFSSIQRQEKKLSKFKDPVVFWNSAKSEKLINTATSAWRKKKNSTGLHRLSS
jgi:hypothetical protein